MKLELIITLQLALELIDESSQNGKIIKKELEVAIEKAYNQLYQQDPETIINLINARSMLIYKIASLNEPDMVLLSSVVDTFVERIEEVRENHVVFFDKLL